MVFAQTMIKAQDRNRSIGSMTMREASPFNLSPSFRFLLSPVLELNNRLNSSWFVYRAFSSPAHPPILVYTMGKVGSTTVLRSLQALGLPNKIAHLHFLSDDLEAHKRTHRNAGVRPIPSHLILGQKLRSYLAREKSRQCRLISLVRDPIAFAISDVFQNPRFSLEVLEDEGLTINPSKAAYFLQRELQKAETFAYVNEWFDRELKRVFGIDVFAEGFPKDVGYKTYRAANAEALVIRLEDLSERGGEAISQFCRLPAPIQLQNDNVRIETPIAKAYKKTLSQICVPHPICEKIYSGRVPRHFYTQAQLEHFAARWSHGCL